MDATDLYADFDPEDEGLLSEAIEQIEYHRKQLRFYQRLKARLEAVVQKSPIEEMVDIARAAWTQR